jgi:hypothetical protein
MATSIKDRAVIVHFTDRAWRGGIVDKKAGNIVKDAHGITANGVGHYYKHLVPKAALGPRANLGMAARAWHLKNTLPWGENGRILPVANINDYMTGMRKIIAEAQAEENKLFKDYPSWVAEAKRVQKSLFNAADYPTVEQLRGKFGIDINVMPLPSIADWRVDLADDQVAELKAAAEKRMAEVAKEGVMDLLQRMMDHVEHAKESLSDGEKTFRDSLINNIKDTCALVAKLNISNDPGLEAIRKETEAKLAGLSPATLRLAPEIRAQAAKDAGDIMRKMASFMGTGKIEIPAAPAKAQEPAAKAPAKRVLTQAQREAKNARDRASRAARAASK